MFEIISHILPSKCENRILDFLLRYVQMKNRLFRICLIEAICFSLHENKNDFITYKYQKKIKGVNI